MYEAFYGLKERPFNLTPDPRYLYLSEKHKEAFAHLLYGIKHRAGFVMVTGEIGTGKTTICRTLLSQLDPDTEVAFIFNPSLSPVELLKKINEDFGIESRAKTVKDLIDELNEYLLDRNVKGKNCVLVIDEAQNLTPSVLEQIRLLSNLESSTHKLLQIVLIGQPELGEHLELRELRQLKQRISARYHLKALDNKETQQYVTYRLRVAGAHRRIRFTPSALRVIYQHSKGTPRVINSLCDRALLIGYTLEASEITKDIANRAAKELRGEPVKKRRDFSGLKQFIPNPTVVALAILAMIAGKYVFDNFDKVATPPASVEPRATNESANIATAGAQSAASAPQVAEAAAVSNFDFPDLMTSAPPEPASEPEPEPDPLTFAETVAELSPEDTRNSAALAIIKAWGEEEPSDLPAGDDVEDLTLFAAAHGFSAELITPSLTQLMAINLPAFVRVSDEDRQLWMGIVGAGEDTVEVTTNEGETMSVSAFEFMERYLAQAVVVWEDPLPDSDPLVLNMRGEPVQILQSQLINLGLLEGRPTGFFGTRTQNAVTELQRETGLTPDGIAGRMTRMVLSSWLPGFETPVLNPESKRVLASLEQTGQPAAPPDPVSVLAPEPGATGDTSAGLAAEIPEPESPAPESEPEIPVEAAEVVADTEAPVADAPETETFVGPPAAEKVVAAEPKPEPKPKPQPPQADSLMGSGGPELPVESFHAWFESVGPLAGEGESAAKPLVPEAVTERDLPTPEADAATTEPDASADTDNQNVQPDTDSDIEGEFKSSSIMPLVPHDPIAAKSTDAAKEEQPAGTR